MITVRQIDAAAAILRFKEKFMSAMVRFTSGNQDTRTQSNAGSVARPFERQLPALIARCLGVVRVRLGLVHTAADPELRGDGAGAGGRRPTRRRRRRARDVRPAAAKADRAHPGSARPR